jgi:RNA polymerase sigma-70 factor (sigma-E family)
MGRAEAEDEFTRFVLETSRSLQRSAVLLTADRDLADDLVQTTYTKLFVAWPRVRRAGNPVAYARRTLTNTFLSQQRLRRNAELPVAELPEPTTTELGHEAQVDLLDALRVLGPLDRAVLTLRYWEDRSVADTAESLGLSESVVRTRSRRALQRLRTHVPLILEDHT